MVYTEFPLNIKRYGSLDRNRNNPSDKCSCKDNHNLKRSVKNFLIDNAEALELLGIVICSLFNSRLDNLKTVQL